MNDFAVSLGHELFGLSGNHPAEPSYRSVVSYYLRPARTGFASPVKMATQQSNVDIQQPLGYLFGLDVQLAVRAKQIAETRRNITALRKATRDPVFGRTVPSINSLNAEVATLTVQRDRLASQLAGFRVVEQYDEHRRRADELTRAIRQLNDRAALAERKVREMKEAIDAEESEQPDHSYLAHAYEQVGVSLPEHVQRRFDEVARFHHSVVSNRQQYLRAELERASHEIIEYREQIGEKDSERASLMRLLAEGGALETFQELQRELSQIDGRIAELRSQRDAVRRLNTAETHARRDALDLQERVRLDLEDRTAQIAAISELFTSYAYELYGAERSAGLTIEAEETGYRIVPTLGSDRSAGVRHMAIFCFDLAMAVTAHRAGRGPDFLVHDSQLYDGVEERQLGSALELASQISRDENLQYIVTLNSDDLEKAQRIKPDLTYHQCITMTDEYAEGGLFGIRFQ